MSRSNKNIDEEICADRLSDFSYDSDSESLDTAESDNDEIIPRSQVFIQKRISNSSETISDEVTDEWSSIDNPPVLEEFLGHPGITDMANVPESIADAVKLFIGDDFFAYLVTESNRYYYQNMDQFKISRKRMKWRDITIPEMKKFLGLIILMGQVRKDARDDYWSTDPCTSTPFFSRTMSRDRFRQIWTAWHFNNNENITDESDRLYKVRPILNYFSEKFNNIYKPKQQISLHEGIIPWRGRLFFKVYNAENIIKYGILIRILSESDTGYICNFQVYAAQGSPLIETIYTVVSPYTDVWHHLYMDNYYNSVDNTEALLQKKIRICGTVRKNRGLPECLKKTNLRKGESIFRRKKDILVQVWQSKKEVSLISSIHSAEMKKSSNVDRTTRKKIIMPNALIDYNKYMKGVDRADQYLSYYSILRKTVKWTKRLTMYIMNCAFFNAYVVYNSTKMQKIRFKKFLHDTAQHWVTDELPEINTDELPEIIIEEPEQMISKRDPPGRLSMDMRKHVLEKIVGTGKKKNPQRQCRVCAAKKVRSETYFMCNFCGVPLHRGKCFERYHTVKNY
ncbi:PREDICTED: piggyBac transposable element-derived protein 4-like [Polistes dominula]|uniref:PiggyBac transposable element-derived protein 4-like n=1 Tax=Polistes dominula TaxID=743375 RepID=A0ABM1JDB7_POLDO|nr:PREDICTED: piggyBac transposable element-derived protein 4-like [Polistes dominula]